MLLKNSSYSEKSNWVELVTSAAVAVYYFTQLSHLPGSIATHPTALGWLVVKVIVISIILAIIVASIFGLTDDKSDMEDERDVLIRRKSTVWSYWSLQIGIAIIMVQVFLNATLNLDESLNGIGIFREFPLIDLMFHGIMFLTFFVQIMQNSLEIFFQRRGY
ncbi:MAG: hypothetical protein L3J46_05820 [Kangiellaceae bacterium]|nr:hypothetical protein [Kangiellaceae bacterium]